MMTTRSYRTASVTSRHHRALAAFALLHLIAFQLFLFANTDYAIVESIRSFCCRVISPGSANTPPHEGPDEPSHHPHRS